jgi:membrane-associated PAP2 superfamily phosphatase
LSAPTPRRWFYGLAVLLMLAGVVTAFVQKGRESAVAIAGAKWAASGPNEPIKHENDVQQIIHDANRWAMLSLAAVVAAMASWGVAVSRRERLCGSWAVIVSLLALWIGLQLIMV